MPNTTKEKGKKMNKDLFDTTAGAENIQPESTIVPFDFNGHSVRVHKDQNNEPWFVAKDVCDILDIGNSRQATSYLDDDEKDTVITNDSIGRQREICVVNEAGIYSLILRSRKPEAKAFKRWVTHEVLPEIRKTGGYIHATPEMDDAEIMARAIFAAQRTIERNKMIIEEQEKQLLLQKPDVEYTRQVLAADNLHTVNTIAVHLGISAIKLNKFLVDEGIIYKQGDLYYPSAKIRNKGYCDYHVIPYINSQGETMTREHLKWTESGRRFVIELYNKRVHGAA